MALVYSKSPTFLIAKKGFNDESFSIPVQGLVCIWQGGQQIPRLFFFGLPMSDGMKWAESLCGDFGIANRERLTLGDGQSVLDLLHVVILVEQRVFGGSHDEVPTTFFRQIAQKRDVIVLTVAKQNNILPARHKFFRVLCEGNVLVCAPMTFSSLLNLPEQGQKAAFVKDTKHQDNASTANLTDIKGKRESYPLKCPKQWLNEWKHERFRLGIGGNETLKAPMGTLRFGIGRGGLRKLRKVASAFPHESRDHQRHRHQMTLRSRCQNLLLGYLALSCTVFSRRSFGAPLVG
jgi:hypothetical protein